MITRAYLRLSRDTQDEASQRQILATWANSQSTTIDTITADYASGGVPWQERGLATVLAESAPGDRIVVSEISRIARSIVGVMTFLEAAASAQVTVVAIANGITLDGSLMGRMAAALFGITAEIDRALLRDRTRAALAARRAAGLPLGRPRGSRGRSKCADHADTIATLQASRVPLTAIARVIGCAPNTLRAYLADQTTTTTTTTTETQT